MSHLSPGLISAYNSLTDKHLAGYFSNTRIRRHLQRAGLITRSGRIVPDKEYRHKLIQRAHQRHVRECLAQAIFHKVLEMERVHQIEIKRRLEEFARRERVHKIKVERTKRYEEDIIRILSPRPPTGARGFRKQHSGPEGEHSESSESPGSSRPNTAPGKMQRPVRLKPIHSNSTTASLRRSSPYRLLESSKGNDQPFNCTMDKESRRRLTTMEASHGISPYCLPVINNFVTPVPPATKRKERGVKVTPSGTLRGRRLRPTTASSGADVNEDTPMLRSSVHQSRVSVNMTYFGKSVHLSHDLSDMRDEVKVFQQHCGGENLCVYKGLLREGETFQFISRRHRGFPFSLTFFLNGLQVERLSSCCEFKHRKGSRLGGRHGHFGFSSVEAASPCYKCIIAMGLDKKPTPPPKRVKEGGGREESLISPKDVPEIRLDKTERTAADAANHSECETSQPQDMDTEVKAGTAAEEGIRKEEARDDYEEDFEADDEGPAEDVETKEKQSPSPSGENQRKVKESDASETEDDEKDDIKSHSGSSFTGGDREESDGEAPEESREEKIAEQPKENGQEKTAAPPGEKDEPNPEESAAAEDESALPKDSDAQNSAGDSTEIDISDTSVPSGAENRQSDDASGDKEVEKSVDESKQEEEQERAKSVQEKLAEAILNEPQCSSEPELSDTSTEEEEESTEKGSEQDNKDAVLERSVALTEQQQTLVEETKCEEVVFGEAEVVVRQEETSEPKEQEDETEPEVKNCDGTKDEEVKTDEEDENVASEENTAVNDKSEDTGKHPVSEEEIAEDDKTSEPQEDAAAKSNDAAEKDEENKEKTAEEADTQPDETGQGAKSSEEDESSVSEPNKKTDETAVPDNAEAEAMTATETAQMKAEPSEEREALNCEEAPVASTEERREGDSEDRATESERESGDTTVEKTAETSEDIAKDESSKDEIKVEGAEEVSGAEAREDDNPQERSDMEEEQTEKSVEVDDKVEEKSEEEDKEEEKTIDPDEKTEGDNSEESQVDDKNKTEGDEKDESRTDERVENEETISELAKSDANAEEKANERGVEAHSGEDEAAEKAGESDKTKNDEDSECVKNDNDEKESEEKGAATDKTNEGEMMSETNTAADEEKDDEAEKEEKDQDENKAEQSEAAMNKDDEESGEKKVDETVEEEEIPEIAEEPEKSADADLDKDSVKISDENIVESEGVNDSKAENVAHEDEETLNNTEDVKKETERGSNNSENGDAGKAANVAHETITAEEMPNNATEAEDVKRGTERGSNNSQSGEINAENGEIITGAENKTPKDEEEAQTEGNKHVETAEHTEEEIKTTRDENKAGEEVTVESKNGTEKCEEDQADQDKAGQDKVDQDTADQDKVDQDTADQDKVDQDTADQDKVDQDKVDQDTADQDKADQDKVDQDKADQDTADQDKADQDKVDQDTADQDKADQDKVDQDKVDQDTADQDTADQDKADQDKVDQDTADQDKVDQDKADQDKVDQDKVDQDKVDQDTADQDTADQDKVDQDKVDQDKVDQDTADQNKADQDKADQAPDDNVVESETKEGDDSVEKKDESIKNNSEPETSGVEIKEESKSDDRKDSEETKQDVNGNISDPDHDNRDTDLTSKNNIVQSNVREIIVAASSEQAQSSMPRALDLDAMAHQLDESNKPSDSDPDKQPHADVKTTTVDFSAADGENGDTEEASKASEEGASVLLKPQAQSTPLTQNNEKENTVESIVVSEETPDALARENNRDLVTNWVTLHQSSRFFETFVEPLEDLKESDAPVSDSNKEATQSSELPRSGSPPTVLKMSENTEQEQTPKDVNESSNRTKGELVELELESNHSGVGEDVKETLQETEVKDLMPEAESEQNDKTSVKGQDLSLEEHKGRRRSLEEDKAKDNTEQTEVESIAGTHHSITSGRPESISEKQTKEKTIDNGQDSSGKQAVEERKDVLPSSEREERREQSTNREGLSEVKATEVKDADETWEKSREVTEITDFTASRSDDGSQEESQHKETQPKPSDESIGGDRRDVRLIQGIQHTLSKERLSAFSVDESLFGQSSHPLLTAARTESGH